MKYLLKIHEKIVELMANSPFVEKFSSPNTTTVKSGWTASIALFYECLCLVFYLACLSGGLYGSSYRYRHT